MGVDRALVTWGTKVVKLTSVSNASLDIDVPSKISAIVERSNGMFVCRFPVAVGVQSVPMSLTFSLQSIGSHPAAHTPSPPQVMSALSAWNRDRFLQAHLSNDCRKDAHGIANRLMCVEVHGSVCHEVRGCISNLLRSTAIFFTPYIPFPQSTDSLVRTRE